MIKKDNKGFTLLEMLISIFILTTVIFIGYGVINKSTIDIKNQSNINKGQLTVNDINEYLTKDLEQASNIVLTRISKQNTFTENSTQLNNENLKNIFASYLQNKTDESFIYIYKISKQNEEVEYSVEVTKDKDDYKYNVSRKRNDGVSITFINNEIIKKDEMLNKDEISQEYSMNTEVELPFEISLDSPYKVSLGYSGKNNKFIRHGFTVASRLNYGEGGGSTNPDSGDNDNNGGNGGTNPNPDDNGNGAGDGSTNPDSGDNDNSGGDGSTNPDSGDNDNNGGNGGTNPNPDDNFRKGDLILDFRYEGGKWYRDYEINGKLTKDPYSANQLDNISITIDRNNGTIGGHHSGGMSITSYSSENIKKISGFKIKIVGGIQLESPKIRHNTAVKYITFNNGIYEETNLPLPNTTQNIYIDIQKVITTSDFNGNASIIIDFYYNE